MNSTTPKIITTRIGTSILAATMSPFVPLSSGATVKESILDPLLSSIWILKRFLRSHSARRVWDFLGHLARPLTPKSAAKAIVFLGRDNGLPWNAALDVRVGSVIRAILTVRRSLPVYPDKQTFSEPVGMSQRCR